MHLIAISSVYMITNKMVILLTKTQRKIKGPMKIGLKTWTDFLFLFLTNVEMLATENTQNSQMHC